MDNKKQFFNTFLVVVAYAVVYYTMQFFLYNMSAVRVMPGPQNLAYWDAGWYHGIAESGYSKYMEWRSAGFFILFPFIWKITHLGVWGICALNVVFFAIGFAAFSLLYPVSTAQKLLWLTIPSLYFMFVPYTEALFFLLSVGMFYGIKNNKGAVTWICLVLMSMTRATAVFLLPALLVMALVCNDRGYWLKSFRVYFVTYALPLLVGFFLFLYYQYEVTGIWMVYFKIQTYQFGHAFSIPTLPFHSHEGRRLVWLGALGALTGIAALGLIMAYTFKWLFRNSRQPDKLFVLALTYLSLVFLQTIFFNPKDSGSTDMMGIHRYSFATPYFFIFLYYIINQFEYKAKSFFLFFIYANALWLLFGSYVHIQEFLFYNVLTLYAMAYLWISKKEVSLPMHVLTAFNFFIQVQLLQQYISMLYPD